MMGVMGVMGIMGIMGKSDCLGKRKGISTLLKSKTLVKWGGMGYVKKLVGWEFIFTFVGNLS